MAQGTGPASTSRTRQADPTGLLAAAVEALAGKGKSRLSCSPWPDPFPEFSHGLRSHHPNLPAHPSRTAYSSSCLGSLLREILLCRRSKPSRSGNLPAQAGFSQAIGVPDALKKGPERRRPQTHHRFQKGSRSSQEGKRDTFLVLMKEKTIAPARGSLWAKRASPEGERASPDEA